MGLSTSPPALVDEARAEREAPLALAPAGAEARVALERLDVAVAARHRLLELVERHVLAAADERLHLSSPSYSQRASQVSKTVTRASDGSVGCEAVPDPAREQLAGRVLEAGDVVQVVVIERGVERRPGVVERRRSR